MDLNCHTGESNLASRLPDTHLSTPPVTSFPFHTCSNSYEVIKRKILFMKNGHEVGKTLVNTERHLHCDVRIRA